MGFKPTATRRAATGVRLEGGSESEIVIKTGENRQLVAAESPMAEPTLAVILTRPVEGSGWWGMIGLRTNLERARSEAERTRDARNVRRIKRGLEATAEVLVLEVVGE